MRHAAQATPPAGDAVVIVGSETPDPAAVWILKDMGFAVYTCAPDAPLPALSVRLSTGAVVVGMIGNGL